jgi:tetratricopeptide (TPR) repeat protein
MHVIKKLTFVLCFMLVANLLSAQSFMQRGISSFNQRDFKQAVTWFNWAIKGDSTNANQFYYRGNAYRNLENNQKAFEDFRQAVKLDSANGDAHFMLGLTAFFLRDYKLALAENTKAVELKNSYGSQACLNRAQTFIRLRKNKKALEDFTSIIKLKDANLKSAHFERAQLYMRMDDKKSALADYKKVVELNPKNTQLTWDIGRVSYEIEAYADALTYYSRAMDQIEKPEVQLYLIRGEVFEKLKHYEAAIEDYTRVIEMNPNLAQAHYSRGQAKARMGDKESACVDWNKASELGHDEAKGVIVYNCK